MWNPEHKEKLQKFTDEAFLGGGLERIEKQHRNGKMTARERIECLFDNETFVELGALIKPPSPRKSYFGDGVITGYGKINNRLVFVASEDFTVIGGTLGEYHSIKICQAIDKAIEMRAPFISINDSGGARIDEGVISLNGYSGIFLRNTRASGVIPQISVILGPCAGGACYSPAISDFIFMTEDISKMFITGPKVVKSVLGENITADDLGGSEVQSTKSGVCHFVCKTERQCFENVRKLLEFLPQNNESTPIALSDYEYKEYDLEKIIPDNSKKVYDVKLVIRSLVDTDSFFEIQKDFAKNVVVAFARIEGQVIGIVANQPNYLSGTLDINASDKAARFIRFCDCFNIPLLTLVDVPGFLPGKAQEHNGIIRHGAKLLYAYSEASVPKVSLILRKAYGGAYIAMNSKGIGADIVYSLPIAEIAVMGAEEAVELLYNKQLENSDNREFEQDRLIEEYRQTFINPYLAAERGYIDEVILPEDARKKILSAFKMLSDKHTDRILKKHGNIPL